MQQTLWQSVLGDIELTVSHGVFKTYFQNAELVSTTDDKVTIGVPNIFIRRQFEVKFNDLIHEALAKNGVTTSHIDYTIRSTSKRKTVTREVKPEPATDSRVEELMPRPRPATHTATPATTLNPRYSFESFIVGSSNDLAYSACQAVAANPGVKYNPLFIYGGVGLGKTHLLQAVGNEVKQRDPNARVLYISSETFVSEFLDSIRFKKKGFSSKYRDVDVLIIDDMQFIAGKQKTQEEFFHTFNALHQANKQIIIGSDKPPQSIPTLTDRLKSRFAWGMSIDIQMPDFETRCAIIEAKAGQSDVTLDRDIVEYLARNVKTNIRELEGALNQLLAYAEMRGVTPSLDILTALVGNVRATRPQHVTPKQIIDKTAKHYSIDSSEICSARRDKHIVVPRQVAMYLLRSELHLSFPRIARELGRKDHTTAIHSVEKIEKAIKLDTFTREQITEIREKLYA